MGVPTMREAFARHAAGGGEGPLDLAEIYAANTATREEIRQKLDEDALTERRRRLDASRSAAAEHRRLREDAWAREWGAAHGRG